MAKIYIRWIFISVVLLLSFSIFFFFYSFAHRPAMNDQDRMFISEIKRSLPNQGDRVRASKIHSGEWERVCILNDYLLPREKMMNEFFGLKSKELNFVNGDPVVSDSGWSILFFYPPNRVESFFIPNEQMVGGVNKKARGACQKREDAVFEFTRTAGWEWPSIMLTTNSLTGGDNHE